MNALKITLAAALALLPAAARSAEDHPLTPPIQPVLSPPTEPVPAMKLDWKTIARDSAQTVALNSPLEADPAEAAAKPAKSEPINVAREDGKSDWWTKVTVTPFGSVTHLDFGKPTWGAGADVGYSVNHYVSIHGTSQADENFRGPAVDLTTVYVRGDLYNDPSEKLTFWVAARGDRYWGDVSGAGASLIKDGETIAQAGSVDYGDWGLGAMVGAELKPFRRLSLGADYSIVAYFERQKAGQARFYFTLKF